MTIRAMLIKTLNNDDNDGECTYNFDNNKICPYFSLM